MDHVLQMAIQMHFWEKKCWLKFNWIGSYGSINNTPILVQTMTHGTIGTIILLL